MDTGTNHNNSNIDSLQLSNYEIGDEWSDDQEKILKSWGDKASCYKLMHDRAHKRFWSLNAWFSIPIIIFSTLTGTGNFSQESFPKNVKGNIVIAIGTINLLSAILLAIKGFLNVAEKGESHKISSVDWDKLGRKIRVELAKTRRNRQRCRLFMDICQEEYNRLIETQLSIPVDIIRWFNKLIETGEYDYSKGGCQLCIHDWFCFPCGIPMCKCSTLRYILSCKFCKDQKPEEQKKNYNKNLFNDIDLPEIIGRINPTAIASEDGENDNAYRIYDTV